MDRDVLTNPRVVAALARFDFHRTTVADASSEVREVLRGVGTVVFDADRPIAVRAGVSSARRLLLLLDRAQLAITLDSAPHAQSNFIDHARSHAELGLPRVALEILDRAKEESASPEVLSIRVDALLALGDVASARSCIDTGPTDAVTALCRARVLIDERRSREAIDVLRAAGTSNVDDGVRFWLGRALLDCDQRREAYALLEGLTAGSGPFAVDAADLLSAALSGRDGHTHR
jgi:hypothetical protein